MLATIIAGAAPPVGELQNWDRENFFTAIRTGIPPSGREMSDEMPWRAYAQMSDTALGAL